MAGDMSDFNATLVGGGPCRLEDIHLSLTLAPYLVGVDGGADRILAADLVPQRVYGDLDSLSEEGRQKLRDRLIHVDEQVTTDFDKALRHVGADIAIAVGFSCGRLDHALAVLNALVLRANHACIVLGEEDVTFLCPPELTLDLPPDSIVSLFPMRQLELASEGLKWPTDGLLFRPDGRVGTSNTAVGQVRLVASDAGMLVILPRVHLQLAMGALQQAPRWPDPQIDIGL